MIRLLVAFLILAAPLEAASFRFAPFDAGLPRSGQWRHGFAVADMNGDTLPDLVFTSPRKQAGPPVIFLNNGGGRWTRWIETQWPALPFDYGAVAAGDFDGNGTNDLAIASHYRGVTVVLGNGNGTFVSSQEGMTFPTSPRESAPFSSRAIVTIDWNRDGKLDVAALSDGPRPGASGVQLGVTVYENLGAAWKPLRSTTADGQFGDLIVSGDVDGDGFSDLITSSNVPEDRRLLRLGADSGLARREVQTLLPIAVPRAADLHDFNDDGRDEIVLAYVSLDEPRKAVIEVVSFPAEARQPQQLWLGSVNIAAVAAGDVNGDGASDVVALLQDGRVLSFRGDAHGALTQDTEIATPEWRQGCTPYGLRLADLDGDARDEVIASYAGENGCASGGGVEVWRTSRAIHRRSARH